MTSIMRDTLREIIDDFAKEIGQRKTQTAKPTTDVIDFRNESSNNIERPVYVVPTSILRFRKDNGRIASDVLSYEKNYGPLDETDEEDQKKLGEFLENKDREKTIELKNSLFSGGQRDPAIITCDGFLINGNRRKLALEKLQLESSTPSRFREMKVVILPGKDDPGGPPSNKEIEQIENRYQLQSDGKAEYYNFDRALSIRRKIDSGISLEDQLRDDPNFINLNQRDFNKEMKRVEKEYLGPLECVDNYLTLLGRDGLYDTVSKGRDDREGRWQAFLDYHNYIHSKMLDKNKLFELGVDEDEVGEVEDAAFKIIREREIPSVGKVHQIMRDLPKWLKNNDAKKELLKITEIDNDLPEDEKYDNDGKEYDPGTIDKIWREKYKEIITQHVKVAQKNYAYTMISETPITLLEEALKKLTHEKMDLESVQESDQRKVKDLIIAIRERIKDLEKESYRIEKGD